MKNKPNFTISRRRHEAASLSLAAGRAVIAAIMIMCAISIASAQRRITPVNTPHTATQPINEFEGDTARIHAKMRATMKHYHDSNGNLVYIDTVTGREWIDSAAILVQTRQPMKYPLMESASVGIDLWNPIMRAFGQHYGVIDFSAQLSMHNRYKPTFETGLGLAKNTPDGNNFTYRSPLSVYFRLGADYNFLYNSTPDYQYFIGVRYGFATFTYSLTDISIESTYWDETAHPTIPSQRANVGWGEVVMGMRVNLFGPISAGWTFRFRSIIHENKHTYGDPWYVPGYGTRGMPISGSISVYYTLPLNKKQPIAVNPTDPEILLPTPETDDPYQPGITSNSSMQEQASPVTVESEE